MIKRAKWFCNHCGVPNEAYIQTCFYCSSKFEGQSPKTHISGMFICWIIFWAVMMVIGSSILWLGGMGIKGVLLALPLVTLGTLIGGFCGKSMEAGASYFTTMHCRCLDDEPRR